MLHLTQVFPGPLPSTAPTSPVDLTIRAVGGTLNVPILATGFGLAVSASPEAIWNTLELAADTTVTVAPDSPILLPVQCYQLKSLSYDAIVVLDIDNKKVTYSASNSTDNYEPYQAGSAESLRDKKLYWTDLFCFGLNGNIGEPSLAANFMFGGDPKTQGSITPKIYFSEQTTVPIEITCEVSLCSAANGVESTTIFTVVVPAGSTSFVYALDLIASFGLVTTSGWFRIRLTSNDSSWESVFKYFHWGVAGAVLLPNATVTAAATSWTIALNEAQTNNLIINYSITTTIGSTIFDSLVILAGQLAGNVNLANPTLPQTATLSIVTGLGYTIGSPASASIIIAAPLPEATVTANLTSWTIAIDTAQTSSITINYYINTTIGSTTTGSLIIAAGQVGGNVNLANATTAQTATLFIVSGVGYEVGNPFNASITILPPLPIMTVVADGITNWIFSRSGSTSSSIVLSYDLTVTLSGGSPTVVTQSVSFAVGSSTATVIIDPSTAVRVERVDINASASYTVGSPSSAMIEIIGPPEIYVTSRTYIAGSVINPVVSRTYLHAT